MDHDPEVHILANVTLVRWGWLETTVLNPMPKPKVGVIGSHKKATEWKMFDVHSVKPLNP